jgi:Ca-activated chloride channel family protein
MTSNSLRSSTLALAMLALAFAGCSSAADGGGGGGGDPGFGAGGSAAPSRPGSGGSSGGSSSIPMGAAPGPGGPGTSGTGGSSATGGGNAPAGFPGSGGTGGGVDAGFAPSPTGNTNVSLGGAQDFGYYRRLLTAGRIPETKDFDAAGFFAEHHTKLPPPMCGRRVCLQSMMAVMSNLANGSSCTMLQLGLNSNLVADPNNRPPLNLAITVDVSGSMNTGGKIDFIRNGLEQLVDGMRDVDKLALITYSDSARLVYPMAEVGLRRAELRTMIRALTANGGTALHDGLKLAFEESLKARDGARQNRVLLLSDGQPTVGITATDAIMAMSKGYNSEGVGLTTIGVGTDFNPVLMRGLSQQADGNFYFLENAAAVNEVFGDELSYFTVPVVYDLKLELTAGAHYNFGRAYGSSFWKDNALLGGRIEVPSVFLAHRKSHADQTPQGGRRGGGSALLVELMPKRSMDDGSGLEMADVATVNVSFRDPTTNQTVTDQVVVNYPHAPWTTPERGFFQSSDVPIVQKSFVMMNIYTAIEDASRNFHIGDRRVILANLKRLREAVVDYNEEIADQDIVADIALLDELMRVLRANGVTDPAEIPPRPNPWPAD